MLRLQGIDKFYGERQVLDDVSFSVGESRMTGFVGGNGAGKTTTMRIILGVLSPSAGTVTLDDRPLGPVDRRRFGYMPEERGLYPKMRVAEQLVYFARLHGWAADAASRNADALLDRLGLGPRGNDLIESLSLGNQQRAQIAAALVHQPEVLILDEPFSGLDPLAVGAVQSVLSEYAAQGAPVLFSSHQLDIVERLCDDLVIIADGRIRADGSREELQRRHAGRQFEIVTAGGAAWAAGASGLSAVSTEGDRTVFEAESEAAAQEVLQQAVSRGPVARFGLVQTSLAQIFREVVQDAADPEARTLEEAAR